MLVISFGDYGDGGGGDDDGDDDGVEGAFDFDGINIRGNWVVPV